MEKLAVSLFAEYRITFGGEVVELRNNKAKALLAYLLLNKTDVNTRESLMTLLWPDFVRQSAQTNLRQTLRQLRTAIPEVASKDGSKYTP